MPELPDVEVFKRYIDSTSLHQQISDVEIRDTYVLKNVGKKSFRKSLEGKQLEETHRYGKYLFVKINGSDELVLHFGMTAFPKYYKNEEKAPRHIRVLLTFENSYHLAYDSQRKLGEVRIAEDRVKTIDNLGLGPDALDENLDQQAFIQAFESRSGMIKPALMNQKIIAGIGNVYSDEILFRSGIHPKSKTSNLYGDHWKNVYIAMNDVLQTAIDCQVEKDCFPASFIMPNRKEGADCPKGCGDELHTSTVSGRTAYYCPKCQEKK